MEIFVTEKKFHKCIDHMKLSLRGSTFALVLYCFQQFTAHGKWSTGTNTELQKLYPSIIRPRSHFFKVLSAFLHHFRGN
jgi:hypothetical protein